MCLLTSAIWALDIEFVAGVDNGNSPGTAQAFTIEKDGVRIDVSTGLANSAQYRFYKKQTVTFTSSVGVISKIVFECTAEGDAQYGPGCFTVASGSYAYEGAIGTWTGASSYVVFTASSNQVRATKIIVTVNDSLTPIITPPSGMYSGPVLICIYCVSEGANIYYTTNGSTPTMESTQYSAPFTINSSTTIKAISELDGDVSDVVTADYRIFDGVFYINNILYITNSVNSIKGLQVNPSAIYSFAAMPPECDNNTFLGYNAVLHVSGASFTNYFMADYWRNFADIRTDAVEPGSVSLNSYEAEMLMGGNAMTLTATVSPNNATPNSVIWSTSNPQVAVVNNGIVTAKGEGECDIVASCLDKRAVCHVTVVNPIAVTLDQTEVTIEQTKQVTLSATVTPEGATYTQNIVWSSSDEAVATVNGGVVTAVGIGECDITASFMDKQAICHVTVIETTIFITLDQHVAHVLPNHMITLTPSMSPLSTELKVTSSDLNVAVARLMNGVVQVAGRAEGTTMVIVSSTDGKAVPDTCMVTVYTEIGDVNCDGYVNISDVTDLIDYLLSGDGNGVSKTNADCDKDGNINIADVTTLIDYLLGTGFWPWEFEAFSVNGVTFKMVAVESGTFTMGVTAEQGSDAYDSEKPAHQVTLSSYSIDPSKIARELGWYPETPFIEGIEKTIRWNLDNQPWVQSVTSGDYQKYYEEMYGNR